MDVGMFALLSADGLQLRETANPCVPYRFPVQWLGRQADDKQRTGILREMKCRQEEAQSSFSYGL